MSEMFTHLKTTLVDLQLDSACAFAAKEKSGVPLHLHSKQSRKLARSCFS
jgi:hypothetical protein